VTAKGCFTDPRFFIIIEIIPTDFEKYIHVFGGQGCSFNNPSFENIAQPPLSNPTAAYV
jgi:hypothetical protein